VLLAVVIGLGGALYTMALTLPGNTPWQVRTVDWVRGHGGGGLVNSLENWWYGHNQPTGTVPAPGTLHPVPNFPGPVPAPTAAGTAPAPLPHPVGVARLPGEGRWSPGARRVGGVPVLYTGYFRPDPRYPSLVVGAAWLNQNLVAPS